MHVDRVELPNLGQMHCAALHDKSLFWGCILQGIDIQLVIVVAGINNEKILIHRSVVRIGGVPLT